MIWIRTIPQTEATGRLETLYQRVKGADVSIDNILTAHSLRPQSLEGHLALYKSVLHHSGNSLQKWFLECLGLYVSLMNKCEYCIEHHYEGLRRLLADDTRAAEIRNALEDGNPARVFDGKELAGMCYAERLTLRPGGMVKDDVLRLRSAGYNDGEILEANQVISYFAYANRTVLGLGVTMEGDILDLSPSSDDPDDWSLR